MVGLALGTGSPGYFSMVSVLVHVIVWGLGRAEGRRRGREHMSVREKGGL